jgi:hypothetical protein
MLKRSAYFAPAHCRGARQHHAASRLRNGRVARRSKGSILAIYFPKEPKSIPVFNSPFV